MKRLTDREEIVTAAFVKLDGYSRLLDASVVEQSKDTLEASSRKRYFGLAIATGGAGRYIQKVHPRTRQSFDLRPGDEVVSINGQDAGHMDWQQIDRILVNTQNDIELVLHRRQVGFSATVKAMALDPMETFYSLRLLPGGGGRTYLQVKIEEFRDGVVESLHGKIKDILQTRTIDGYIVDLQANQGGSSDEALNLVSLFVKDRTAMFYRLGFRGLTTADALPAKERFFLTDSAPVVVLTNGASMSAAEVATASLKALGRAVTVGAPTTFGKLVAQNYFPVTLANGRELAMLVTSTELFDPGGKSLNGTGVASDVVVFSQGGGQFHDGNGKGEHYVLTPEQKFEPYPAWISQKSLLMIQNSLVLDRTDINEIALRVLDTGVENRIF